MLGFGHAWNGLKAILKTERNFKVQMAVAILVILLGFFFDISSFEWLILLIHFSLVLSLEAMNTFTERLCDLVHPDYSSKIKIVKDVSASAVLIAAIFAAISGFIVFYPYLLGLIV
jgi:diacylglycerol kinase